MIKFVSELQDSLSKDFKQPQMKLQQLVRRGELFKVVRGIYETDSNASGEVLASSIYGPSYLSFEYALFRHGIIPEQVQVFTSATFGKNKTKKYNTTFGTFTYQDIPASTFAYGVYLEDAASEKIDARPFALASPEKALCDKLYSSSPLTSVKQMQIFLFENLRVERSDLKNFDWGFIRQVSPLYRKRCFQYLEKAVLK